MMPASKYIVEVTKYQFNRSECPVEWIKYTVYIFVNLVQRTMLVIGAFKCFVTLVKTFIKPIIMRFIEIKNLLRPQYIKFKIMSAYLEE